MKLADYFKVGEAFGYFFRKKDPNRPSNFSLKMMHGTNKLSMGIFILCVLVILYRYFIR
jgi:hypothetical protein